MSDTNKKETISLPFTYAVNFDCCAKYQNFSESKLEVIIVFYGMS